ncbi:protein phosphatase 2C domain-containing protein [Maridesulfovibrio sp.]|uniref:PP2C family protein-serine/threonine phosphatase n=1 Tax=Maridesulfovibrio sp. TaxID=2795000 RepID=UPI0029C9D9ED|nr:protein phosphatase 2C domain-containing protein [Maridesulfovibrio sp.]
MQNNESLKINYIGMTDVGNVRELNEDTILVHGENGLFVVADGMGGHGAGDKASQTVCQVLEDRIGSVDPDHDVEEDDDATVINIFGSETEEDDSDEATSNEVPNPIVDSVSSAVVAANFEVFRKNSEDGFKEGQGMGTTVAGMWVYGEGEYACLFHIGDSRVYRFRRNELVQLTTDHSMFEEWKRKGQVGEPPKKNILMKAMGPFSHIEPDTVISMLTKGDIFLICSDGLTGMITDAMIADILAKSADIDQACAKLIDEAKAHGGKDNVSVILVQSI